VDRLPEREERKWNSRKTLPGEVPGEKKQSTAERPTSLLKNSFFDWEGAIRTRRFRPFPGKEGRTREQKGVSTRPLKIEEKKKSIFFTKREGERILGKKERRCFMGEKASLSPEKRSDVLSNATFLPFPS